MTKPSSIVRWRCYHRKWEKGICLNCGKEFFYCPKCYPELNTCSICDRPLPVIPSNLSKFYKSIAYQERLKNNQLHRRKRDAAKSSKYRSVHREEINRRSREKYHKNLKINREIRRLRRNKEKEKLWRDNNKDRIAKLKRQDYIKHKESRDKYHKQWCDNNRERIYQLAKLSRLRRYSKGRP